MKLYELHVALEQSMKAPAPRMKLMQLDKGVHKTLGKIVFFSAHVSQGPTVQLRCCARCAPTLLAPLEPSMPSLARARYRFVSAC